MTDDELLIEWDVTYWTRIGNLCGKDDPTPEQKNLAGDEADAAIAALRASLLLPVKPS